MVQSPVTIVVKWSGSGSVFSSGENIGMIDILRIGRHDASRTSDTIEAHTSPDCSSGVSCG